MSDDMNIGVEQEEDFSQDGIVARDVEVTLSDYQTEELDENRIRKVFVFTGEDLPFPITLREWSKHTTPKAQEIGRGNIKKYATALTGSPKYNASTIVGSAALAKLGENKNGFATLTNFRQLAQ